LYQVAFLALEVTAMFERLSTSWDLAVSSWQVLKRDKQLLIFPVLSGIGCSLVLVTFLVPLLLQQQLLHGIFQGRGQGAANVAGQIPWWGWVGLFAYYFCNYFVVVFFNAALISCALIRFNGGEPTISDGLNAAASRLPQILAWALVSATVGVLLKVLENAHEKAGALISAILGTVWSVITYFVVPVLVVEKVGPYEAVKRSMQLLRRTWGEALIGHAGVGLFIFVLALPWIALAVIGAIVATQVPVLGIALLLAALVYFLLWLAIGPALNGIFLGALYQYAASGEVPRGFSGNELKRAFRRKR
jgi:hypothetical protein